MASAAGKDRTVVLWLVGAVLLAIALFAFFGPRTDKNDPTPSTENPDSFGVRGAYVALGELGYDVARFDEPTRGLDGMAAAGTTLVFLNPKLPVRSLKETQGEVANFLRRGGRVIATGQTGAELLPGGETTGGSRQYQALCVTTPEGPGALARVGPVHLADNSQWAKDGPEYEVAQRCGPDAVVVRYRFGAGEVVWMGSAMPFTNQGLPDSNNLKLVLAALGGKDRRVVFDEYLEDARESVGDLLRGLPWWSLGLQALMVGGLLVLSRGRRNGPVRMPMVFPRNSPVEFAESMGRLYGRAGATEAAVGAARARVVGALREQCGVPREMIPVGVAEALTERLGGDWRSVEEHLVAPAAGLTGKSALGLVRALDEDYERISKLQRTAV